VTARGSAVIGLAVLFAGCGGGGFYDDYSSANAAFTAADAQVMDVGEEEASPTPGPAPTDPAEFVKSLPANPRSISDGLVRSRDWKTLPWANPADVSPWRKKKGGDDVVLVVMSKGGKGDKTAVSRLVRVAAEATGEFRIDVYSAGPGAARIAVGVFASVDRVYSESMARDLKLGWNRVVFDLSEETFKTAASEWRNTSKLWGPDDLREIVILFYHDGPAAFSIDGIEIDGKVAETD